MMGKTKKMVFIALLVALASVLHVIEAFIPNPLSLPGVKLGLANVVTLLALMLFGFKEGIMISILRVLIGSLIGGTFLTTSFFLSFSGALVSTLAMALLIRFVLSLSIIGVSVVGAVIHNVTQLCVAYFIVETVGIFYYLPFLLFWALPMGIGTGIIAKMVGNHLKRLSLNMTI